ncbi:MAG: DUF1887 family CARF protein [Candidatus Heimdallarchaeota archaeon]|nr:DUF1887 family CARF protein [Candidatus Heimdallarchaeota archaeon]
MTNNNKSTLFLTIGGSPLPIAISLDILHVEYQQFVLIHSIETEKITDKIRDWLKSKYTIELNKINLLCVDSVSPSRVKNEIFKYLKNSSKDSDYTLGLCYTGGNKIMSLNSYETLSLWSEEHSINFISYYIDGKTNQFITENKSTETMVKLVDFLGKSSGFTVNDITRLHDWDYDPVFADNQQVVIQDLLLQIVSLSKDNNDMSKWLRWTKKEFKDKLIKKGKDISDKDVGDIEILLSGSPNLHDTMTKLRQITDILTGNIQIKTLSKAMRFKRPYTEVCGWFTGKWLEHWVYFCLKKLQLKDKYINEISMNATFTSTLYFELDVLMTRGYDLFVISCTTLSENRQGGFSDIKKKLFEISIRARQIGGFYANFALVSFVESPKELQEQLRNEFLEIPQNVAVFGLNDLIDLELKLDQWIDRCNEK